jgi:hypothetical protein
MAWRCLLRFFYFRALAAVTLWCWRNAARRVLPSTTPRHSPAPFGALKDNFTGGLTMKPRTFGLAIHAIFCVLLLCLCAAVTKGQTTRGSLSGLVKDAAGAAVSGAAVTARHIATGLESRSTTDAEGAL